MLKPRLFAAEPDVKTRLTCEACNRTVGVGRVDAHELILKYGI